MYFPNETIKAIDQIFAKALDSGRKILYEHEIYQILTAIGLNVPYFIFIKDPAEINEDTLRQFPRELMVKIVSPQVAHKQKLGGVKKINNTDPLFVQYVMSKMRAEVLSHFITGTLPEITGYLLVEFIPHTQALGYEQLIGFKEDPSFGPVLTLSKGGDDAEFFAQYFNPANLFLPPLDNQAALKMVNTLNIRHKFNQIGHPEYLEYTATAISRLSSLAYQYSFVNPNQPSFIIKSLDINPFVISEQNRLIAIDGFAEFIPAAETSYQVPPINLEHLENFFSPRGIAVIGVSSDINKYSLGREIAHLLHDLGRKDLYLVNARGGTVRFGETDYPLYQQFSQVPAQVDLVVYAASALHTIDFVKELTGSKVKSLILISGIPAEINYSEFLNELRQIVPPGLRIIGPNCMGVFYGDPDTNNGVNTLFVQEKRLEIKASAHSNTVLLTQSGAFSVTALDKLQNSRLFKAIVSFGNKSDVNITDLMAYFNQKPEIDLIALYLEGLQPGEGRKFFELAQEIAKPVILYKSGRTEAGAKAAASHTASISGSYDVFKAACQQAGVILADHINDLYDYIKIFSLLAKKRPAGNRVAGVVNAGFESTVGADELQNLRQAVLTQETVAALNRINRHGLVDITSPFLDITPMADDRMYAEFVETVLQDPNVDCIFVAVIPHAVSLKTTPETCNDPDSLANLLVGLGEKYHKPMVISVNAGRYYQDFIGIMERHALPVFTDIRSAIKALDRFVAYHTKAR